MATPASLLDMIGRGGSLVGFNEAQRSQAGTALTQAQVPQVQAETAHQQAATAQTQQATRAAELENQQRELALRDNAIVRDAMTKTEPVQNEDPATYLGRITDYARKGGISAGGYIGLTKNLAGALETKSKLTGEALTQHGQMLEQAGGLITALKTADPTAQDAVYAREQPALDKLEPGVFPAVLPADPTERAALIDQWAASHKVTGALLGQKKTEAEISNLGTEADKNKALAGEAVAKTPGEAAKSQREQLITAAMQRAQTASASGQHPIDAILPETADKAAHDSYKSAYDTAMANGGPEAATHIASAAAQHAAQIAMASNPQVRAGEVAKAVAVERATGPLKVQQQVNAEIEKAKLAPDSFNSIVDPRARAAAEADYSKDSKEYADKVGEADRLKSLIAAAQQGNKAAPGVIPIEELRGFVNRVNAQELKRVSSGAGDALDRVSGFIKGYTSGQPIPAAVLADTAKLADLNAEAAKQTYHMKVQVNNATHGGKVKPIEFNSGQQPTALSTGHSVGDVVDIGGKKYKISKLLPNDKFEADEVK